MPAGRYFRFFTLTLAALTGGASAIMSALEIPAIPLFDELF